MMPCHREHAAWWCQYRAPTRDELPIAIVTWIEGTYHCRRRQARLGRLTPIQSETIMTPSPALAA